jgi:hypothetical protein
MRTAYRQRGLESDEVLALVAYLEDADRETAADAAPLSLNVLLLGLAGAVLGLATVGTLWGTRSHRRERAITVLQSPADYVGAGL